MRFMKRSVWIFSAVLCAALLLSGCQNKATQCLADAPSSAASVSSSAASAAPFSQVASSVQASSAVKQPAGISSQGGIVKTIGTDSKSFDEKFKKNPIDASYAKAINQAISNLDMVKVSDKYAGLWEKEIIHAYAALKKDMASDSAKWKQAEDSQKSWESGKDAALKKIADDASAMGGSQARVQASSDGMEYYRARAAVLYRQLYDYDKNYTYAFAA